MIFRIFISQPTFTCSKLTIEILEQGVNFEHVIAGRAICFVRTNGKKEDLDENDFRHSHGNYFESGIMKVT